MSKPKGNGKPATFVGGPLDGQSTTVAGAYRCGEGIQMGTTRGDGIRRSGTGIYALNSKVIPPVYRWLQRD